MGGDSPERHAIETGTKLVDLTSQRYSFVRRRLLNQRLMFCRWRASLCMRYALIIYIRSPQSSLNRDPPQEYLEGITWAGRRFRQWMDTSSLGVVPVAIRDSRVHRQGRDRIVHRTREIKYPCWRKNCGSHNHHAHQTVC